VRSGLASRIRENASWRMFRCRDLAAILAAGITLLSLISCSPVEVKPGVPESEWLRPLASRRKQAGEERIIGEFINGAPARDFLMLHGGLVSSGPKPAIEYRIVGRGLSFEIKVSKSSYGSAASLGGGYFLTAAHVLSSRQRWITSWEVGSGLVTKPCRVVWKSDEPECDLALIHAPVLSPGLPFVTPADLRPGQPLFSFGFGNGAPRAAGGRLISCEPCGGAGGDYLEVVHGSPIEQGDSGGPVVTADGKLAGIQSRVDYHWWGAFGRAWVRSRSFAHLPDAAWIAGLIEEDRKRAR
jgi:S1-C subfamily serine protease